MRRSIPVSAKAISAVRVFNRFYTRQIGLLDEHLLKSAFSLTEARVLYELAHRQDATASGLRRELNLDAGYLSRLLKRFARRGLVKGVSSPSDARQTLLTLTPAGHAAFEPLNQASNDEVLGMLQALPKHDQDRLVAALQTAQRLLGGAAAPETPFTLRPLRPGDLGWIIHRQGVLYAQEYGWDETYEALVAEIAGAFGKNHDPQRERCWVAEQAGEVVGSIFLVRASDTVAKLRLLYVEPSARGLGLGRRLVDECVRFAKRKGYRQLTLWTNASLVSARRIYEAAGFILTKEETHRSFGKDLVGQTWDLDLRANWPASKP